MDIKEIKKRIAGTSHFFDKETMEFFGQKLSDFEVYLFMFNGEECYRITAPIIHQGNVIGQTDRVYQPSTNKLIPTPKDNGITKPRRAGYIRH
jgi:hypothetical protein